MPNLTNIPTTHLLEAKRLILQAAVLLAPTSREQMAFCDLVAELAKDPEISHRNEILYLINTLKDGLEYGNWPGGE